MANQYNSYYLYQKYEKRGNQSWLPCYPNIFSVDGDGTMPLVLKQENDQACGYIPPGETMYRWINLDPSVDYYCLECGNNGYKISGFYGTGDTFSVNCNSSPTLTSADTSSYSGMTYAKIGDCVTAIGDSALALQTSLKGVSLPSNITSIGNEAFKDCLSLTDCVFPSTVTSIGDMAFWNCSSLRNLILWNTITSIGGSAFTNCDYLEYANIPTGLTSIPNSCFSQCGALSEIKIPDNITSIGDSAFESCGGLMDVSIGSGVTSIGNSAFYQCSGLTRIRVEATTPPTLGNNYVFNDTNNCPIYVPCDSVSSYKSTSGWSNYASRIQGIPPCDISYKLIARYLGGSIYNVDCNSASTLTTGETRGFSVSYHNMTAAIIGDCVTSIGGNAFDGCGSLTSVTIPNSVTGTGMFAFQDCTSLTSISIPSGITTINTSVFKGCYSLTGVTIPSGVTNIKNSAFEGCSGLTSVNIPSGVTIIMLKAFQNCSSLTSITVNATMPPTLGDSAFTNTNDCPIYVPCESVNTYKSVSGWSGYTSRIQGIPPCETPPPAQFKIKATYTGGTSYSAECNSTTLTTGDTKPSGYDYSAMTSAEIGDCVTTITGGAFSDCISLLNVTIPSSVTDISYSAFRRCTSLTNVDIPSGVTSIKMYTFTGCTSLSSVTIPDSVTSIEYGAFEDCSGLTSITINASTPPSLDSYAFHNTNNNFIIYVPSASVSAYQSAWSTYASRIQAITS